jgi:protein-S-isoprenylcysteine O-methyltransferase Ste14
MGETFFHLVFVFIFIAFTVIRMVFHRRATLSAGKVEYREGRLHTALRLLTGIPFMLALLAYMINPAVLAWAELPLPRWAHWLGVVSGLASLALIYWVHTALGENFSTTLHLRENHTLVTGGPYRWVRHPMYTVLYIHLTGIFLLTGNWFLGGVYFLALSLIILFRLDREEATMIEKFGDQYRQYMLQTGRFLPRIQF